MLPLKAYIFSEQEDKTPMKIGGPGDLAFQNSSVTVSSKFWIQNRFKGADWDDVAS